MSFNILFLIITFSFSVSVHLRSFGKNVFLFIRWRFGKENRSQNQYFLQRKKIIFQIEKKFQKVQKVHSKNNEKEEEKKNLVNGIQIWIPRHDRVDRY